MFNNSKFWIGAAQIPLAWEWLKAGWDKLVEGGFGGKFAEELPRTLGFFSSQPGRDGQIMTNPHTWYVDTFLAWAKANPNIFGYAVVWGEFLLGIVLFLAIAYLMFIRKKLPGLLTLVVVVGLLGGIIMNLSFYFASGWPASAISTRSLNIMMILTQVVFIGYYLFSRQNEA
jgi:hypothetical protein